MSSKTKHEVIQMIERLPDDVSLEDIMYHLYVRQRIERGLEQVKAGELIPNSEVMQSVNKWLRRAGP